jgi:vacuolar-type H+-ATPase subunit H
MPDVQGKLDEIITMVETAKGKALSGSAAVIDRSALLALLEDMRALLPAEMSEARSLLRERTAVQDAARVQADELLADARDEADRELDAARDERDRMVSESAVVVEAERVAAEILADARSQAARMREQTDDYVDASLERFEQLLATSLDTVTRGRARVAASREETSAEARYDAAAAAEVYDVTDQASYEASYDAPYDHATEGGASEEPEVADVTDTAGSTDAAWESGERTAASA